MEENEKFSEDLNNVSLRIAQTLENVIKISERIVGYVPYEYVFAVQSFHAISNRPAKITPLERAILGILKLDGYHDLITIGSILGFDIAHDTAESEILTQAVENMRNFGVIEGDDSFLILTDKGEIFASTGERPETFSGDFEIWIDPKHPLVTSLKNDLTKDQIQEATKNIEDISLDLDCIKKFAEQQASNFHKEKLRFILSEATRTQSVTKAYKLYICFLQSVRDGQTTLLVYDDYQKCLIPSLSEAFNSDAAFKNDMLDKCIKLECEIGEAEIVPNNTVKSHEQEAVEQQLITDEDNAEQSNSNVNVGVGGKDGRLHKKALYDSLSFEAELHNIFTNDGADEIWLISPWIGKAFVRQRLSYITNFLSQGNKIFIAFSEEETSNSTSTQRREMIDREAAKAINDLKALYPTTFFCVQLPAFHTKNVIEKKGDQIIMFTGSFNILSFTVNSKSNNQIRREEMALAHHQVAANKYADYLSEFISIYIDNARVALAKSEDEDRDEDVIKFNTHDITTLISMQGRKEQYIDFFNEIEKRQLLAKNALWNKDVAALGQSLTPYFTQGAISNRDRYNFEKRFNNLTRRFVGLTISPEDKLVFDELHERFTQLSIGKNVQISAPHTDFSECIDELLHILSIDKRGRRLTNEDIIEAKRLSGPQNQLASNMDLLKLLIALNLLNTAIKIGIEKKIKYSDVNNSLKRIIKKREEFNVLSVFINSINQDKLIFDLKGLQFTFRKVYLPFNQITDLIDDTKLLTDTKPNMQSGEMLDVILNKF